MKLFIFGITASLLFFAVTTSALEDMTRQDCEVNNIQAACLALKKWVLPIHIYAALQNLWILLVKV